MTQVMKSSDVRQQWSQLLNRVFTDKRRIVVEKSGIPVAAVISAEELKHFIKLEEQRKSDFRVLDDIREAFKGIPAEKLEREVNKALTRVRAEKRAKKS